MSLPEPVLRAVEAGLAVVPADNAKRPKVPWKRWTEERQTKEEAQKLGHGSLWSVITGEMYGFVVLDFDGPEGLETMISLGLSEHVRTAGGAHVYVTHPGHPVRSSAKKFPQYPGLDIKGERSLAFFTGRSKKGAYSPVLWPPEPVSLDPDLAAVLFPHPSQDPETPAAEPGTYAGPGHGTPEARRYLTRVCNEIIDSPPGASNSALNKAAYAIGGLVASGQLREDSALEALVLAAETRGAQDVYVVLRAALDSGLSKPWKFEPLTDEWVPAVAYRTFGGASVPDSVSFPIDALPDPLSEFVRQGSSAVSCPPDYLGAGVLPILGVGIGGLVDVAVTESWSESALLYVALIGQPGARKSPAMSLLMKPIWEAEGRLEEAVRAEAGDAWQEVEPPSIVIDDATIEALFGVLERNPRGLLLSADELTGWVSGMNQYKGGIGRDRQHWLSIWSRRPVKVSRVKSKSRSIRKPFVSVLGGIQPEPLEGLLHGKDDGLLPRLLMARGEFVTPQLRRGAMDPKVSRDYDELWNRLRDEGTLEATVPFTSAGYSSFETWVNEHYKSLHLVPAELAGAWAKMDGQAARICLILARVLGTDVTPDVVDRAIALVRYFMGQAGALLAAAASGSPWEKQQSGRLKSLARYLQEHPEASRAELLAFGPEWAMDAKTLDRLLETLEALGVWNG
jgi:hypothetical protein